MRSQSVGQLAQHTFDFALLFNLEFAQPIAEFHRRRWLDEYRFAGARTVVHDAADVTTGSAPHRHHPTAVAHRHREIAHLVVRFELAHLALEQSYQLAFCLSQVSAHASQRGRRIILDDAVVGDGARDCVFLRAQVDQRCGERQQVCDSQRGATRVTQGVTRAAR